MSTMPRITYTDEERTRIKAMSRLDNEIAALPMRPRQFVSRFYKAKTLIEAEAIQDLLGPVQYHNAAQRRENCMMGELLKRNWIHVSGRI